MPCTFIDSLIAGLILNALQQCTGINMSSISVVDLDSSCLDSGVYLSGVIGRLSIYCNLPVLEFVFGEGEEHWVG